MKKLLFNSIIIFLCSHAFSNDQELLKVLKKELAVANKLLRKVPTARNDYRVFSIKTEQLKIYRKIENQNLTSSKNTEKAREWSKKVQVHYKKTKNHGLRIAKKYKKFKDRGKFSLIFGLMIFSFEPESTLGERFLKDSIRLLKEKKLKHLATGKLADYYFNSGRFEFAEYHYKKAIRLIKNSEWRDKYMYNLAWSQFKVQNYRAAVKTLKNLHKTYKDDYFKQQAANKIPLFLVYASKPKEAYQFVISNQDKQVKNYLNFINLVYDKGFFDSLDEITFSLANNLPKKKRGEFFIGVYEIAIKFNFSEYYRYLIKLRKNVYRYAKKSKKRSKKVFDLDKQLLNSHLVVINRKAFSINDRRDKLFFRDSRFLLTRLIKKDSNKKNLYEYTIKLSQLHFKAKDYEKSFDVLYKYYKNNRSISKNRQSELLRLLILSAQETKIPLDAKEMTLFYEEYLKVSKAKKDRKVVYLKLFDLYYESKEMQKAYELAKKFHSEYPKDGLNSEVMLLKLLSHHLVSNEVSQYNKIKRYVLGQPRLRGRKELKRMLTKGYQNLVLFRINKLTTGSKGNVKKSLRTAKKLENYFRNTKIDRVNRFLAGFKAIGMYMGLGKVDASLILARELLSGTRGSDFGPYAKNLAVISQEREEKGDIESALSIDSEIVANSCRLGLPEFKNNFLSYIEKSIVFNEINRIYKIINQSRNCIRVFIRNIDLWYLINKYIDINDYSQLKKYTVLLNDYKLNDGDEIDKILEKQYIKLINARKYLDLDTSKNIFNRLIRNSWSKNQAIQSSFYGELRRVFDAKKKIIPFETMTISEETLGNYIEKNISIFTNNLDRVGKIKTDFYSSTYLKKLYELHLVTSFMRDLPNIDGLLVKKDNLEAFKALIVSSIKPLESRVFKIKESLGQLNAYRNFRIQVKKFGKRVPYDESIDFYMMDKLL